MDERHVKPKDERCKRKCKRKIRKIDSFHLLRNLIGEYPRTHESTLQPFASQHEKMNAPGDSPERIGTVHTQPFPLDTPESAQNTTARTMDRTINRNTRESHNVCAAVPLPPTHVSLMASEMGPTNAAKTRMRTRIITNPVTIGPRLTFRIVSPQGDC